MDIAARTDIFAREYQRRVDAMNDRRAAQAARVLSFYGFPTYGEDVETQVSDLLADLRHFCALETVDFNVVSQRANDRWTEEQEEL
jgi:hypothetical protein